MILRVAHEFGLDPWAVVSKWTHRQLAATEKWLGDEWNRPNRTDHYLMALNASVTRGQVKNPGRVTVEKMRLKFSSPKSKPSETDRAAATASGIARDVGIVGGRVEHRTISRAEYEAQVAAELDRMERAGEPIPDAIIEVNRKG